MIGRRAPAGGSLSAPGATMTVIPVLDVMAGEVVRGVGGRRSEYRPIVSNLCRSAKPLELAAAIRDQLGLSRFYLADLDAIAGTAPALGLYGRLRRLGLELMVDAGVRRLADVDPLLTVGVETVVIGLETLAGPLELSRLVDRVPADRLLFSLDMKDGALLGRPTDWPEWTPTGVLEAALEMGLSRFLLLDLARVGVNQGVAAEPLARWLLDRPEKPAVLLGGGVRGPADLDRLRELGLAGVLVASALHDGRLSRADLLR